MSRFRLLTQFVSRCAYSLAQSHGDQACLRQATVGSLVINNKDRRCLYSYSNSVSELSNIRKGLLNDLDISLCLQLSQFGCRSFGTKTSPDRAGKSESKASAAITESELFGEASKLGIFAKFKLMYKKYWYVMVPVHMVTSLGWFGGFYYMSKSGVDVGALLQYLHISESIIAKVHGSDMGHLAVAYLCYKVATPVRYAVTLGGTTVAIKYLVQSGYIKPLPSKQEFIKMYEQKKADLASAKAEKEADGETEQEIERQSHLEAEKAAEKLRQKRCKK